jgi:hypothetical protein
LEEQKHSSYPRERKGGENLRIESRNRERKDVPASKQERRDAVCLDNEEGTRGRAADVVFRRVSVVLIAHFQQLN